MSTEVWTPIECRGDEFFQGFGALIEAGEKRVCN